MGFGGGKSGGKGKGKSGGKGKGAPLGPPDEICEVGVVTHTAEEELICKCTHDKVPYFNGRIFLEDKQEIGKLDEIFGPINSFSFSVKMAEGMKAESFKEGAKMYIDTMQLLPMERFLPQKSGGKGGKGKGKGGKGKGGKGGKGKGGKGKSGGKGKGGKSGGKSTFKGGKW